MNCRFCKTELENVFVDLINSPASNSYLNKDELNEPEVFYPLKLYVCDECKLVQIDEYKKSDDIFDKNYVVFDPRVFNGEVPGKGRELSIKYRYMF